MKYFEWDPAYNTGVEEIDRQHIGLLELVNKVKFLRDTGSKEYNFAKIIGELIEYTKVHFKDEEKHMAGYAYPKLAEHKLKHEELIKQIHKILLDYKNNQIDIKEDIYLILVNWVIEHIKHEDFEYAKYLKNRNLI